MTPTTPPAAETMVEEPAHVKALRSLASGESAGSFTLAKSGRETLEYIDRLRALLAEARRETEAVRELLSVTRGDFLYHWKERAEVAEALLAEAVKERDALQIDRNIVAVQARAWEIVWERLYDLCKSVMDSCSGNGETGPASAGG